MARVNIPTLIQGVYGAVQAYRIKFPGSEVLKGPGMLSIPVLEMNESRALSMMGTPVYDKVTIEPATYRVPKSPRKTGAAALAIPTSEFYDTRSFNGFEFPDAVLVDVSQAKKIVKTEVNGRNGTVKEYIGLDDFQITFRGVLANYTSGEYPIELVRYFYDLFVASRELTVKSEFLRAFGIYTMVVESFRFEAVEGNANVQPFTLECLSDQPIELVVKDAGKAGTIRAGL